MQTFELTIPQQYIDHINKEIKKPKRPNTELLELWLERELSIANKGNYGNLPTDESLVTVEVLPNGNYKVIISDVIFGMIKSHVQPEPHSHKIHNEDIFHCWLDLRTNKSKLKNTSKSKKHPKSPFCGKVNPVGPQRCLKCQNPIETGQVKCSNYGLSLHLNCGKPTFFEHGKDFITTTTITQQT